MEQIGPFTYDEATRIAAEIIHRHYANPSVGADNRNPGKYAAYFCASEYDGGEQFRSVGGFDSVSDASRAIPFIVADTVIEDVSVWDADTSEEAA